MQYIDELFGFFAFAPAVRYAFVSRKSKLDSNSLMVLLKRKQELSVMIDQQQNIVESDGVVLQKLIQLETDLNKKILNLAHEKSIFPFLVASAAVSAMLSPVFVRVFGYALDEGIFKEGLSKVALFIGIALVSMALTQLSKERLEKRTKTITGFTALSLGIFFVLFVALSMGVVALDPLTSLF